MDGIGGFARLMVAQTLPRIMEFVKGMEQKLRLVAMKGAPALLGEEEFVLSTVQRLKVAAIKDATTTLRREEFVLDMVLVELGRVAMRDVVTIL